MKVFFFRNSQHEKQEADKYEFRGISGKCSDSQSERFLVMYQFEISILEKIYPAYGGMSKASCDKNSPVSPANDGINLTTIQTDTLPKRELTYSGLVTLLKVLGLEP